MAADAGGADGNGNGDGNGTVAEFTKILAGVVAIVAALTALGKTTGVADAILRNYAAPAAAIFAGALLAGLVAALAGLLPAAAKPWLLGSSAVLFFAAVLASLILMTISRGDHPSPSIQVRVKAPADAGGPLSVNGAVSAAGLATDESLQVVILVDDARMYQARVGSDDSGHVKVPFDFLVDEGTAQPQLLKVAAWVDERPQYCFDATTATAIGRPLFRRSGCVLVQLPRKAG